LLGYSIVKSQDKANLIKSRKIFEGASTAVFSEVKT